MEAFEIEKKTEHKLHSAVAVFSHSLRPLQERGIVEKQVFTQIMGEAPIKFLYALSFYNTFL